MDLIIEAADFKEILGEYFFAVQLYLIRLELSTVKHLYQKSIELDKKFNYDNISELILTNRYSNGVLLFDVAEYLMEFGFWRHLENLKD